MNTLTAAEHWVGKAMGVRDVRSRLNFYYSDGARLICTDGHRLHLTPTTLPQGYYGKALNPVDDQGRYPEVDRVINLADRKEHTVLVDSLVVRLGNSRCSSAYELPQGGLVDMKYWAEATKGREIVTYHVASDNIRIDFEDGSLAIVMGMRLK